FQAEDGIRDFHVTGVQTCALPISHGPTRAEHRCTEIIFRTSSSSSSGTGPGPAPSAAVVRQKTVVDVALPGANNLSGPYDLGVRSEERRVGKECRSRWAQDRERER